MRLITDRKYLSAKFRGPHQASSAFAQNSSGSRTVRRRTRFGFRTTDPEPALLVIAIRMLHRRGEWSFSAVQRWHLVNSAPSAGDPGRTCDPTYSAVCRRDVAASISILQRRVLPRRPAASPSPILTKAEAFNPPPPLRQIHYPDFTAAFGAQPTWRNLLLASSRSKMTH